MASDPAPTTDPGEGGVIIIKGGSCELDFDDGVFTERPAEKKRRKHKHDKLRIIRIAISGEPGFPKDFPDGFTGAITITCKP